MRVAIPSTGEKKENKIDIRFGRAPYFFIGESENDLEAITNKAISADRGAGVSASQMIVDQKVEAVIGVNFGPRSFWVLNQAGITIYRAEADLTVGQALAAFKSGKLKKLANPTGPGWSGKANE